MAAGPAEEVPQSVRNLLTKARTAWLKNTEVLDLLSNYQRYNFSLNKTTPNLPPGAGLLFGCLPGSYDAQCVLALQHMDSL